MLLYLKGEAFCFFYKSFTTDGALIGDGKKCESVNKARLMRLAKVEDPQRKIREATEAGLISKMLT